VKAVVCSDLDRTLIYSANALALSGPDDVLPRLVCVEFYQARPLSYILESALPLLEALTAAAPLVPVTTRTPAQYRRVQLLDKPPQYAICSNGGHILVDGVDDADWAASVRSRVMASGVELAEVSEHLARVGGAFVSKQRIASDLFAYLVVDRASLPGGWISDLTGWCAERGWRTSLQGRKVYCLPAGLSKAVAAAEVARRLGADRMLAAGDSLLDTELLEAADAALRPAHGELASTGWIAPSLTVTAAAGVLAGVEILDGLLEQVAAADRIPAAGGWRKL
jgi:hypothetical protein